MNIKVSPTQSLFRSQRFMAIDDDRYSPCYDPDCSCRHSPANAQGFGETPEAAISDLKSQLEEADGIS